MYPLTSLCDPLSFWNREKPFTLCRAEHFLSCRMNGNHLMMKLILSPVFKKIKNTPSIRCHPIENAKHWVTRFLFPVWLVTSFTIMFAFLSEWTHTESETLTWLCAAHVTSWGGEREKRDVGGGLELVKVSRRSQAFRPIADQTISCSLLVWCLRLSASVCTCVAPQCMIRKVENLSCCERNSCTQPEWAVCCHSSKKQE